ncbi:GTPase ObgE [Alicyclobacillus sp. ALC3]|uniref:GTPase ObgE n=1 Tax=Alicyclobacillus sp. ALC3 TaxID=2796143 RepID=UPI0023787999|nr:GTPase ObgE [Alicyclobacillus sp. ALC3]WDL99650.1 GTPase ObgE [Alicyclobacillus sp. ALC3]
MFVDHARIYVKGGDGGNGIVSYRREKFVPLGGPAGGDGGRGGNVVFVVDEGLRTLVDFRYQRHYKATRGDHGGVKNQHGKSAPDMEVKVPPGTVVREGDSGEFLGDLVRNGQRLVVARGGRGGRGNSRFATEGNKAPDMAEKGEPGEEHWLLLELKVLADVGLVGFPSVGKSTLLSTVTSATPKIGAYPFTTLSPELGVVAIPDGRSFVIADLPGLIEGAHQGHGLGLEFLRHVERTRLLLHVIDMAAVEGRDPLEDYNLIQAELAQYNADLTSRPQFVVANKMDITEAEENLARFRQAYPDLRVFPVSGATRQGLDLLVYAVADALDKLTEDQPTVADVESEPEEVKVYRYAPRRPVFTVRREGNHFVVESEELEKLVKMTNFAQYDAVKRFQKILRQSGVDQSLRNRGASEGDVIQIGDMEFEFVE